MMGYDDTDSAATDAAAAEVVARMTAYGRARRTLFEWMHPGWRERVDREACLAGLDAARGSELAGAFLADAGIPAPPLESFRAPGTALILLNVPAALAALRLRALWDRTDELRSWIDRPRRARLAAWVGEAGARLLLTRRRDLGDTSSAAMAVDLDSPAETDDETGAHLAAGGLLHFAREGGHYAGATLDLLRFALPPARVSGALAGQDMAPPSGGANPSLAIASQLGNLFDRFAERAS